MLKRRDFLKHSVVVATAASTGVLHTPAANAVIDGTFGNASIHFVIVDEASEDSVAFAQELIVRGARAFAVQQDLGQLWFGELGAAFAAGHAIAGLTSHTELMICTEFARQRGARVRYEGAHDCRGADHLTHALHGDAFVTQLGTQVTAADVAWPRALATGLATRPLSNGKSCVSNCRAGAQRSASNPGSLFSWVIS